MFNLLEHDFSPLNKNYNQKRVFHPSKKMKEKMWELGMVFFFKSFWKI